MMEFQWVWFIRIALIGVLLVLEGTLTNACLDQEKIALLQLKPFFNHYNELADWDERKFTNCCEWEGIECDITSRRIIGLSLNSTSSIDRYRREELGEYWYLNTSMFLPFVELKSLSLQGNAIAGCIENEGFQWFSRLGDLETLDLSVNSLKNNIMSHVSGLSSLKTLILGSNGLEGNLGHIPGLNNLTNLKHLDLSWNKIESISNQDQTQLRLTKLEELNLSGNLIRNNTFSFLKELSSLKYLIMSDTSLQGSLNIKGLNYLTNLKKLDLSGNRIESLQSLKAVDPFRRALFRLQSLQQQWSGYLKKLQVLDLSENAFEGILPHCLGNLTSLRPLVLPPAPNFDLSLVDISDNKLQGQIPSNICSTFPYLRRLFLSKNVIRGNIPSCLSGIKEISILDLSNNQLSGSVPEELITNSSLSILRLSNNMLGGNVIPAILKANGLERLYLDGNNFSGEMTNIGVSVFEFSTSIWEIDLSNNMLCGKLPRWIENWSGLETLALSNNRFKGSIPMEFCNLNYLRYFDLSQNNLSGSIPSCFNPPSIQHVHLHGNRLSGPLSLAFYNSSSLVTLDLRGNNLSGSIPKWIGTLSSLGVLLLKANHLHGRIPVQLCKLYSLNIIDLSQNMFSSPIPSCLGNLTLPTQYNKVLQHTYVVGYLRKDISTILESSKLAQKAFPAYPESYKEEWIEFTTKRVFYSYGGNILEYMTGIDLSCNKLIGQIPPELGNLNQIHSLNLSYNNLIGDIPSSFSKLNQIESLDLSYNNLSGEIPNQLVELKSLEVFSVAHNNLSGSIPESKAQFGTFDESSYKGNPFLCGPMLHKSCSKIDPPSTAAEDDEEEDTLLDIYVFRVSFLASYAVMLLSTFVVLHINPYWRRTWFSFVEKCITTCCYSTVGNFLAYYIFRRCV
ncbi:hypothetical protein V6N11_061084 [Hibiscus sabdariffa]|uniref:Leucine-rich repeat-containing N-terminal plant-type domain-containing protein n=1 Tax=Hibiscus sabdariffa TaxID=183260 RepID=A0ABR2QS67_9ROSI